MRRPVFIAQQSAKPTGFLGRIIAAVMEQETKSVNKRAVEQLNIQHRNRVLDIGCGHGRTLSLIAELADEGLAVGVDHSSVMCARATTKNRALIAKGRIQIEKASSDNLPFEADAFDAALGVHTMYFWDPAEPHLREIARVLRPGGRLMLVFRAADDPGAGSFPTSIYRFRTTSHVKTLVSQCGFAITKCQREYRAAGSTVFLLAERVRRNEVQRSHSLNPDQ